jgi:DNA-binding NtrC family response regulator
MGENRREESTPSLLVVEDEPQLRRALASLLRASGWRVASAGDWQETWSVVDGRERPVEILVADVVLPGESGVVVADRLESRWPSLQTILVSGYSRGVIEQFGDLEGDKRSFMAKPLEPAQLLATLDELAPAPFGR